MGETTTALIFFISCLILLFLKRNITRNCTHLSNFHYQYIASETLLVFIIIHLRMFRRVYQYYPDSHTRQCQTPKVEIFRRRKSFIHTIQYHRHLQRHIIRVNGKKSGFAKKSIYMYIYVGGVLFDKIRDNE